MQAFLDWLRQCWPAATAAAPPRPRQTPSLDPPPVAAEQVVVPAVLPPLSETPATAPDRAALDAAWLARLTGLPVPETGAGDAAERAALRRVVALADPARFDLRQLPRLPAVLPALLGCLRGDDVDVREVARLIGRDPVLLGEVMRIASSALHASRDPIRTLMQAILRLGTEGLRLLVVRAVARPIWRGEQGWLARHAAAHCAAHAERCASLCMSGSADQGARFEGYLAGLFAASGTLPLLRAIDREPGLAGALAGCAWAPAFETGSTAIAALAAGHWQLPPAVAVAIGERGGDEAAPRSPLGQRLDAADRGARSALLAAAADMPPAA